MPPAERNLLFRRCLATITDPEYYLKWWFCGANAEDIKRKNVGDLIRWAFFNGETITGSDANWEVEGYINRTEEMLGRRLAPGKGKAKSLRTTLDPVRCTYRSLLWHVIVGVVDAITHCILLWHGFSFYGTSLLRSCMILPIRPLAMFSRHKSPAKHITYFHRPHTSRDRLPVLFIHGVGVGLWPYTTFFDEINKDNDVVEKNDIGIIAIEIMAVANRLTFEALDREVLVKEINSILIHHSWDRIVLMGHSYGTVISAHLLKSPLTCLKIGPVVLVDPICFLLHLPNVAYNFTVRKPKSVKEYVLWYFGSMDIGVAHTLGRRFFWSENVLWKEDLVGRDVTVVLSEGDDIVDVRAVRDYLTSSTSGRVANEASQSSSDALLGEAEDRRNLEDAMQDWQGEGVETVWLEGLHHAQPFDFEVSRAHLAKAIKTYTRKRT